MRWPWQEKKEKRESQPFTDAIVAAIAAQAGGTEAGDVSGHWALECASGLYSRAFAGATVEGSDMVKAAVGPRVRALIGRDLIRRGESLHLLTVDRGALMLTPAGSWDVRGGPERASWFYRLDIFGPSGNRTHFVPGESVVHCLFGHDAARPWHGISPLGFSRQTAALAANLELRLSEEASASVGTFLPLPEASDTPDDEDEATDPQAMLRADIRNGRGRHLIVETTAAGFGEGKQAAAAKDWKVERFGANPPATLRDLRGDVAQSVLSACGVPVDLALASTAQGAKEAFRRFTLASVEPLAALVAAELSEKLDAPVRFDFSDSFSHDLAGRAMSFQRMVTAGMPTDKASSLSGLTIAEGE